MSGQQAGIDWAGMAVIAVVFGGVTVALLVSWWRDRVAEGRPLTAWGARRMKARARAAAPDWGPALTDAEWKRWRCLVGAYVNEDEDAVTGPMGESW